MLDGKTVIPHFSCFSLPAVPYLVLPVLQNLQCFKLHLVSYAIQPGGSPVLPKTTSWCLKATPLIHCF